VDDAELIRSELTRLTDRVVEVEALVRRLEQRVGELSSDRLPPSDTRSPVSIQTNVVPSGERIDLEQLATWVDRMQERYAATGDWLRPCWWRHGFVVEELAALRTSWLGVYSADEPPAPTAALTWHEQAEKCRERIRRTISTGPGCTAVNHKSDQSVTGDPRWAEERAGLFGKTTESPSPARNGNRTCNPPRKCGGEIHSAEPSTKTVYKTVQE
jgi:hypothetical protein